MSTPQVEVLSAAEREQFAAVVERLRQFRRRTGVPDGVRLEEAVALHMISVEEMDHARSGALPSTVTEPRGSSLARDEQVL